MGRDKDKRRKLPRPEERPPTSKRPIRSNFASGRESKRGRLRAQEEGRRHDHYQQSSPDMSTADKVLTGKMAMELDTIMYMREGCARYLDTGAIEMAALLAKYDPLTLDAIRETDPEIRDYISDATRLGNNSPILIHGVIELFDTSPSLFSGTRIRHSR